MRFRPTIPGLRLWLLGIGLYLLFLLLRLPAALVLEWLPAGSLPPALQYRYVSGNIWSGTLHDVRIRRLALGDVHWRLTPWSLLTGRLGANLRLEGDAGDAGGWFGLGFGGTLAADAVAGTLNLHAFDALTRPVMLDGRLHLAGLSSAFKPGEHWHLSGEADWQSARIGGVQDIDLGNVHLAAEPKGDGSTIRIRNQAGDLQVEGSLLLDKNGGWQLDTRIANRDANRKDIQQLLRFLGRPDASGRYRFRASGKVRLP